MASSKTLPNLDTYDLGATQFTSSMTSMHASKTPPVLDGNSIDAQGLQIAPNFPTQSGSSHVNHKKRRRSNSDPLDQFRPSIKTFSGTFHTAPCATLGGGNVPCQSQLQNMFGSQPHLNQGKNHTPSSNTNINYQNSFPKLMQVEAEDNQTKMSCNTMERGQTIGLSALSYPLHTPFNCKILDYTFSFQFSYVR